MRAKIIGFTQREGQDYDCEAITDTGEKIIVDPYAGCSWEYEDRHLLRNEWFEDENAFLASDGKTWLTSDRTFRLIPRQD